MNNVYKTHSEMEHNYNPSSELQASFLTPPIFYMLLSHMSDGTYALKSNPNDKFEKLFIFHNFYLLLEFLPEIY